VWLAAVWATGFAVDGLVRRTERHEMPLWAGPVMVGAIVICIAVSMIVTTNNSAAFPPEWYDGPSWVLGIALMSYAAAVLAGRAAARSFRRLRV
jgi:hypothetical protein